MMAEFSRPGHLEFFVVGEKSQMKYRWWFKFFVERQNFSNAPSIVDSLKLFKNARRVYLSHVDWQFDRKT